MQNVILVPTVHLWVQYLCTTSSSIWKLKKIFIYCSFQWKQNKTENSAGIGKAWKNSWLLGPRKLRLSLCETDLKFHSSLFWKAYQQQHSKTEHFILSINSVEPRKHVNYLKSFLICGHISFWGMIMHNVNVGVKLTSLYPLTWYQNLLDILATTWQRQLKNPEQTLPSPISLGFESSLSNQHWTSIPNCCLLVMRKDVYVYSVDVWEKGDTTTFQVTSS